MSSAASAAPADARAAAGCEQGAGAPQARASTSAGCSRDASDCSTAPSSAESDGAMMDQPVALPQHGGDGAPQFRTRRVPLLRLSAARADRRAAHGRVRGRSRAIANRWHEAMGVERHVPGEHTALPRALPRGGPDPADAAAPVRTGRATTTACTRICTGSSSFRCRWQCCCPSPGATSRAASSCSPSSARACSRASRWCRCAQGDAVVFAVRDRPVIGTRGVATASKCGMA